jgi:hypothetical protein
MALPPNLITNRTARMPGDLALHAIASTPKRGRQQHTPGKMNKAEAKYSLILEGQKRSRLILDWKFESIKLRLADRTWLTVDFAVLDIDGRMELHEIKGHVEDDFAVKWKVAKEMYPHFWFRLFNSKTLTEM